MVKGGTKKEIVFERLKSGEDFRKVKEELGAGTSTYDGLRMYLDWVGPQVDEWRSQLAELERGISEMKEELGRVSKLTEEKVSECEKLEAELASLRGEHEKPYIADVERVERGRGVPEDRAELLERLCVREDSPLLALDRNVEVVVARNAMHLWAEG